MTNEQEAKWREEYMQHEKANYLPRTGEVGAVAFQAFMAAKQSDQLEIDALTTKVEELEQIIADSQKQKPIARLLTWKAPNHIPAPHGGVCARTYVEYPIDTPVEQRYWFEGSPLYASPIIQPADKLTELIEAANSVCARWDSPKWKDQPHTGDFIHRLRQAVTTFLRQTAAHP